MTTRRIQSASAGRLRRTRGRSPRVLSVGTASGALVLLVPTAEEIS